jgi:hypothetical protein
MGISKHGITTEKNILHQKLKQFCFVHIMIENIITLFII